MIDLRNNFLMQALKLLEDKKYYFASLMFCSWAEDHWLEEKNQYTVKHGVVHLHNIIRYLEGLFSHVEENDVLSLLGPEYIFILISCIYSHDVGMQAYYDTVLPYLSNDAPLDSESFEDIRINHADIISEALTRLNTRQDIISLFGKSYQRICNMIEPAYDNTSMDEVVSLILNNKRQIAVICSHHNKDINILPQQLNRLIDQKKLFADYRGLEKIKVCAALLQVGDALDMSINRINSDIFLARVSDDNLFLKKHISEIKVLKKMFLCYLIDDIEITHFPSEVKYIFKMSCSALNKTENYEQIRNCRKIYSTRLSRDESDSISILERFLNIRITIHLDSEEVRISENKKIISPNFFKMQENGGHETLDSLLEDLLKKIKNPGRFVYIKLYSEIAETFFGGIALCDNPSIKQEIENLFFHIDEWHMDSSGEYYYCKSNIITSIKRKRDAIKYHHYANMCQNMGIKSEVYYTIRHDSKLIGFINLHFADELTEEQISTHYEENIDLLNSIGYKIVQFHQEVAIKKYKQLIDSCRFINHERKATLTHMHRKTFARTTIDGLEPVPVANIVRFFGCRQTTKADDRYYVRIHYKTFEWLFDLLINNIIPKFASVSINIKNETSKSFIEITFDIVRKPELMPSDYLRKACAYLEIIDVLPQSNIPVKNLEYLLAFKSFFTLFGGKIFPSLCDDNQLTINVLMPKKQR